MENELVHTASISTRSSPPARGPLSRGTLAFWLLPTLLSKLEAEGYKVVTLKFKKPGAPSNLVASADLVMTR